MSTDNYASQTINYILVTWFKMFSPFVFIVSWSLYFTIKNIPPVHYNFFSATGCGRSLGMTTGDIKDYQIETSSNYKDIHQSRAMQGIEGWCSSATDMNRWLMVS